MAGGMHRATDVGKIEQAQRVLTRLRTEHWLNDTLFSLKWWLLVILLLAPWAIWWRLVDRKRLVEIVLFGSMMMIVVATLDEIGVELGLWLYPAYLFPFMPRLVAIDCGTIVVAHMLVYQYFRKWNSFLAANVILALLFAFVAEPLCIWIGIYRTVHWELLYSFPIYILKAVAVRFATDGIYRIRKV